LQEVHPVITFQSGEHRARCRSPPPSEPVYETLYHLSLAPASLFWASGDSVPGAGAPLDASPTLVEVARFMIEDLGVVIMLDQSLLELLMKMTSLVLFL